MSTCVGIVLGMRVLLSTHMPTLYMSRKLLEKEALRGKTTCSRNVASRTQIRDLSFTADGSCIAAITEEQLWQNYRG